jgi:hypothetical protein
MEMLKKKNTATEIKKCIIWNQEKTGEDRGKNN